MEVYLVRKLFIMPGGIDDDDFKIVDEVRVFSAEEGAFKQFRQYCADLSEEVGEGDLLDSLKDNHLLYALTNSGKSLRAWIERQNVIE